MDQKEIEAKIKKANEVQDVLGSYFEKEELDVGTVISVLMNMLADLLKDSDTPPHHAMMMFGAIVTKHYENEEDEPNEKGVAQWLN